LGDALRGLEAHLNVQNRGTVVHLEIASGVVVVSLALYEPMGEGAGSIYSDSWGARVPYRTLHSADAAGEFVGMLGTVRQSGRRGGTALC